MSAGAGWPGDDGVQPAVAVSLERIGSGGVSLGGEVSLIFSDSEDSISRGRKSGRSALFVASGLVGRRWNSARPVTPFLNVGVAAIRDPDCCGTGFGGQVGGGIDYALSSRVAIRSAASLAVPFGGEGGVVMLRLGVAFR